MLAAKLDDFETLLADTDAVVLSDYGKGGLAHISEMIALARAPQASRCWSTPRATTGTRYRGATLITPNRGEFREVAGRWSDEADFDAPRAGAARASWSSARCWSRARKRA